MATSSTTRPDQSALVTGGSGGLGTAMCRRLVATGRHVVVADVDPVAARDVADRLTRELGGSAEGIELDVRSAGSVAAAIAAATAVAPLTVAVNNAGVRGPVAPLIDVDMDDWTGALAVNLVGVALCLQAELRVMPRGGSIINVTSVLGTIARPRVSSYVAAKHAVIGLTKSAALEAAEAGIRVNAVAPAWVETAITSSMPPDLVNLHPVGRLGTPDEVAAAVAYLADPAAGFTTGSTLMVDGGFTAQ